MPQASTIIIKTDSTAARVGGLQRVGWEVIAVPPEVEMSPSDGESVLDPAFRSCVGQVGIKETTVPNQSSLQLLTHKSQRGKWTTLWREKRKGKKRVKDGEADVQHCEVCFCIPTSSSSCASNSFQPTCRGWSWCWCWTWVSSWSPDLSINFGKLQLIWGIFRKSS